MNRYDFIFIVLVYRNIHDLVQFFDCFTVPNSKVIVVNSYYDEKTKNEFEEIAKANSAIFLNRPNGGYGAGNNYGVDYAIKNFEFDYLVISNADVMIEKFLISDIFHYKNEIIAPQIIAKCGRNQNPNMPYILPRWDENFRYWCYKNNHSILIYLSYAISRVRKILFNLSILGNSSAKKIYSAHGCFIIFPYMVIKKLHPLFNPEMFLFHEELHLAKMAQKQGISTIYNSNIKIRHKEDGSISFLSEKDFDLSKQSYLVYYDYWYNRK